MRYRLRTLLIVVTAIGMVLGWIAWLRQTAAFHRRESIRIAGIIASSEGVTLDDVKSRVEALAPGRSVTKWVRAANGSGEKCTLLRNGRFMTLSDSVTADVEDWSNAIYHSMLGERFERALYQPWILFAETAPTPRTVYVPLSDDKAWFGIARPPMVEVTQ